MLKLTTTNIEEIRSYFLATSEENQRLIQKNIRPSFLSNFLPEIKQLFNAKVLDEIKLESIAKSMGAEDHLKALKEIKQDYYSYLTDLYNFGVSNPDIEVLFAVENDDFLQEVDFQKELKTAFQLNERASLKKKFQQLDKESEISAEEMSLAFKLFERKRLKEQFQKIEYEAERNLIGMVTEAKVDYSLHKKTESLIPSGRVIKFKWKHIAIAATIVGLIMTTTVIIFVKNKTNQNIASNNRNRTLPIKENTVVNDEPKNNFNDLLAKNILIPEENQISVLKEQSFGFAAKDEKLIIRKYYIKKKVLELEDAIASEMKSESGTGNVTILKLLRDKRDSINNLANKYSFNDNVLSIYVFSKKEVTVFKINLAYYLIIEDQVYECKNATNLLPIKNVTDKAILEKSKKIMFNNSN